MGVVVVVVVEVEVITDKEIHKAAHFFTGFYGASAGVKKII
jgi:hypothetical protein